MFDSLQRQFKFMENFMGSSRDDVMEAIFEVDVPASVTNVFMTDDDRELGMEDSAVFGQVAEPGQNGEGREGRSTLKIVSPALSPTKRDRSQASRLEAPPSSPLARLFGTVRQRAISGQGDALGDIRRIGEQMEKLKEATLPGEKLRQEIKELSERQVSVARLLTVNQAADDMV